MKIKLNSKFFGITLISAVIITIGGVIFLYLNDPKIKFMNLLNKEYTSFKETIDGAFNSKINTLSKDSTLSINNALDFNLNINETNMGTSLNSIKDIVNTLTMNLNYASDNTKGNTAIIFNSKIGDKPLFDGSMYKSGDKTYYYLTDVYDKYIESSSVNLSDNSAMNAEDSLYIINKIKTSLVGSLKTSDFTSESKTITINNENVNTNRLTLTLTNTRLKEIIKTILTDMKNDSKCLTILSKYTPSDVKTSLETSITSINNETLLTQNIKFDMYVKDNTIVQLDVYSGVSKVIQYLSYKTSITNSVKDLTLYYNDAVLAKAYFEKKSVDDIYYELTINSASLTASGNVYSATKEVVSNKEWTSGIVFTTNLKSSGLDIGTLTINGNTSTKIGKEVTLPDLSNSVKETDITKEEQTIISNKILDRLLNALPTISANSTLGIDLSTTY